MTSSVGSRLGDRIDQRRATTARTARRARARSTPAEMLRAPRAARRTRRRADCVKRSCAAGRGRVPRFGQAPVRAVSGSRYGDDGIDQGGGGTQKSPARTRSIHAGGTPRALRAGTPARRRAAGARRSGAACIQRRFGQAAGARRVGSPCGDGWLDQGELRQPKPPAYALDQLPAEIARALRAARPRGGVLLA